MATHCSSPARARGQRAFVTVQLDADGHTVQEADSLTVALAKRSTHDIDVLILSGRERPPDSRALSDAVRAASHARIHPGQPVISLGRGDELTVLHAYVAVAHSGVIRRA